jgi:hypothetical protein
MIIDNDDRGTEPRGHRQTLEYLRHWQSIAVVPLSSNYVGIKRLILSAGLQRHRRKESHHPLSLRTPERHPLRHSS